MAYYWAFGCFSGQIGSDTNFEEFALGEETSSYFALEGGYPIHLNKLGKKEIANLSEGWKIRGQKDVILILGNSQTHGINQYKEGQKSYNHYLFKDFSDRFDIVTHSIQNANLQEHYLSFEYWNSCLPVKYLVLPVFMDDLREDEIRVIFFSELFLTQFQITDKNLIAKKINSLIIESASQAARLEEGPMNTEVLALRETVQEKSELKLNEFLNEKSEIWSARPTLRGDLFVKLYQFRNTVLGISSQTKRNMIPARYDANMTALKAILNYCSKAEIEVLLYIPPVRNDVELPYVTSEYRSFKSEIQDLAAENEYVKFANLEGAVPGQYWGMKASTNLSGKKEYDFMHFQETGHILLYENLKKELELLIE